MSILNMFTSNNFLSEANKTDSIKDGEKKEDPNMITAEDEDNKKKKNDDTEESEDPDDEAFDDVDSEVDSFDEPSKLKSHSPDDLSPDDNPDSDDTPDDLDNIDSSNSEDNYDDTGEGDDLGGDDSENNPDSDDTSDDLDNNDSSDGEDSYDDTGEGEDDLSQDDTEKNKLKLKKLLDDYFDLYSFINEMINSFENINEKDKIEFSIFSKISDNLQSLKYSINDYINIRFTKSSYEANLAMYYKITNSVKITDKIISNIIENRNKH